MDQGWVHPQDTADRPLYRQIAAWKDAYSDILSGLHMAWPNIEIDKIHLMRAEKDKTSKSRKAEDFLCPCD
jgi:hypothetical protein